MDDFESFRDQGIPEGLRGGGGQKEPAAIWNMDPTDYMRKADPWPLNPNGELLLGLKIEDRFCLPDADNIAAVPGISKSACDKSGLTFLCSWQDENLTIEERARHALHEIGARILHVPDEAIANKLRKEMGRKMPW